jgi:hypothetical protein
MCEWVPYHILVMKPLKNVEVKLKVQIFFLGFGGGVHHKKSSIQEPPNWTQVKYLYSFLFRRDILYVMTYIYMGYRNF